MPSFVDSTTSSSADAPTDRMAKARATYQRAAAERAAADPRQLARAARIIAAALEQGRLTVDDLTGSSA